MYCIKKGKDKGRRHEAKKIKKMQELIQREMGIGEVGEKKEGELE